MKVKNEIVMLVVCALVCALAIRFFAGAFESTIEDKRRAAERTVDALGLRAARVVCDPSSYILCYCLVSYESGAGRRLDKWSCCGGGCD